MALTSRQRRNVKKLADSGNKAAQKYLKTGKVGSRNERVTDSQGRSLSIRRDSSGKAVGLQRDTTITADSLKPAPKISLPTPPSVDGLFGTTDAINAGLASLSGGTYDANTKQIVPAPVKTESPDNYTQLFQSYLGAQADNQMPSMVDSVKEQQKMLKPYENRVNSLQNQLNTITTARDAQMLGLEGQGRGQTQSFIGGEQARISREAAITALPIQAQLAAAQDDLESARTYAGQYFQAKMQDAQNLYNYKKELNASIFSFLTAAEQRKQAANEKQLDREYAERQAATSNAQNIALQAIEYGQSSLAGRIMGFDPQSPTYAQDVRSAMAELRKPVAGGGGFDAPTVKTINGVDMQWNAQTGTWETIGAGAGQPDAARKSLDQLTFLRDTAKLAIDNAQNTKFLRTPIGPSFLTRTIGETFIGNTSFKQLQNQTDTLKTNVLALMTDPNIKKFFGPQMSNADVRLMSSTGSTLNPQEQTQKEYVAEVKRLDDLFNRMQTAVQQGLAGQMTRSSNVITAPDGRLIEIID